MVLSSWQNHCESSVTWFIWWMQTKRRGGRQPSDQANRLGLRVRQKEMAATVRIHHRHLLLLSPRTDTHFTVPRRVEVWVDLGYTYRWRINLGRWPLWHIAQCARLSWPPVSFWAHVSYSYCRLKWKRCRCVITRNFGKLWLVFIFTAGRYASAVFAVIACPPVRHKDCIVDHCKSKRYQIFHTLVWQCV